MRLWCAGLGLGIAFAMAALGFLPSSWTVAFLPAFMRNDKALHGFAFFLLTVAFYFIWEFATVRATVVLTAITMIATAIISEIMQGLLPYRGFDENDILANMVGITAGLPLSIIIDSGIRLWRSWRGLPEQRRWVRVPTADDGDDDIELGPAVAPGGRKPVLKIRLPLHSNA
ncbi:hypothetical protein DFJ73DRAFT_849647 [Zopfochytrium polystomum]|nr:hypothetical protein DFJ73DRAFT_849647 [Zopfochytrium polystomum]